MDWRRARERLEGCYITIPTMFRDSDLAVDIAATRKAVRFLIDRGIHAGNGTLLAGGAAGVSLERGTAHARASARAKERRLLSW